MYKMCYKVEFTTEEGEIFLLDYVHSIEINKSVDNLVETCTISLPSTRFNQPIALEEKIKRGVKVEVSLGYDDIEKIPKEFKGFITSIEEKESLLKIECEGDLFLFKKTLENEQLDNVDIKELVKRVVDQIDSSYAVDCQYTVNIEKFTINEMTAYDVLKKLKDDYKAMIWFDSVKSTLHIHGTFLDKLGDVTYSMHHNVETSKLKFSKNEDKKVEVIIKGTDTNGYPIESQKGEKGGDTKIVKADALNEENATKVAEDSLKALKAGSYSGSFTCWLIPFVAPGYSAEILDDEYPDREGRYYVKSVKTSFSSAGGVRTIEPGLKLSVK